MLTLSATSTAGRRVARPSLLHLSNSLTYAMAETAQRDVLDQSLSTSTAARHDSPSSSNEHTRSGTARHATNDAQTSSSSLQRTPHARSLLGDACASPLLNGSNNGSGHGQAPCSSSITQIRGPTAGGGKTTNIFHRNYRINNREYNRHPPASGSWPTVTPQQGRCKPPPLTLVGSTKYSLHSVIPHPSPLFSPGSNANSLLAPKKSVASMECLDRSAYAHTNLLNACVNSTPTLLFDLSDFPPITTCANQPHGQGTPGTSQCGVNVSAVEKGSGKCGIVRLGSGGGGGGGGGSDSSSAYNHTVPPSSNRQTSPRFSMDEDFPALPTAQKPTTPLTINESVDGGGGGGLRAAANAPNPTSSSSSSSTTTTTVSTSCNVPFSNSSTSSTTAASAETAHDSQSDHQIYCAHNDTTSSTGPNSTRPVQFFDNHYIRGIPNDMVQNQFGMLGLLKLTEIESPLAAFAPGFDLSKTDFENWPPPGDMHNIMASPFSNQFMLPPHDTDWHVPAAYRIRHRIADRLPADPPLAKLTDAILFWIFYNCCREEVQFVAAKELYNRKWRYHKRKKRWLTRVPGSEVMRDDTSEQSTYYLWEPLDSAKVLRQMTIQYSDLDHTPTTYQLSSPTLNATVQPIPPIRHRDHQRQQRQQEPQQQQQQHK
ncbi:CCR4 NOT transcription complex subunit 2 [Echinococcus multilocularis]|uniref:CCR4 NOT transcription complex subunit 2 n=1 Tax=Echinococcus multilocularis TaxID=6211 RepID=A0A087VZM2_ECHMU|nr:CCR4 NOT transcription complex subunit 2 [Echinococcus multilocularis]